MKKLLFWVGALLMAQACIISLMRVGPSPINPQVPCQYSLAGLQVFELQTRQSLTSEYGSLCGGLALWLLCLHLRAKKTEREIIKLRSQLESMRPTAQRPEEGT